MVFDANGSGLGKALGGRALDWRVVLYARVSTDEQAKRGFSLAQQLEALRAHCAHEGWEVVEEVRDEGWSGAYLERPGLDRVRDLVASEAGGVFAVLTQDRDRLVREPAYHYLLKRELAEHGTKLISLNDRGDGSPEGELTDGIIDQISKYERAKIVERSRRGKLRKAREGKVVAGPIPNYGFYYNKLRDGYEVDEGAMAVVRRLFRMIGVEGVSLRGVIRALEAEGIPNPSGGRYWCKRLVKRAVLDDLYKPHAFKEIAGMVGPEVAARLDPDKQYGVWWFNRRRTSVTRVAEEGPDGGRTYRRRHHVSYKDRGEWIAVPVPESGVPRETVEAARAVVSEYRGASRADGRFWELSGALMRCGECGRAMEAMVRTARKKNGDGKYVFAYYRCREGNRKRDTCSNGRSVRSDHAHPAVWDLVSGLLLDPERLRAGLERMIEEERAGMPGDPEQDAGAWREKLAEADRRRSGYLDLAADGLMERGELREKLAALEEVREAAERGLRAIEGRAARLRDLEREKEALLEEHAGAMPEALDALTPEDRHEAYHALGLDVRFHEDGTLEVTGSLNDLGLGTLEPAQTS